MSIDTLEAEFNQALYLCCELTLWKSPEDRDETLPDVLRLP